MTLIMSVMSYHNRDFDSGHGLTNDTKPNPKSFDGADPFVVVDGYLLLIVAGTLGSC